MPNGAIGEDADNFTTKITSNVQLETIALLTFLLSTSAIFNVKLQHVYIRDGDLWLT